MTTVVVIFYGLFVLVSVTNLVFMTRPRGDAKVDIAVGIPCRNEASNIGRLVAALRAQDPDMPIYVFDDESTDGTAELAEGAGAIVLRPKCPLGPGWTGKNRACYELGNQFSNRWFVFLDADVYPREMFLRRLQGAIASLPDEYKLVTGFLEMKPGKGVEPLFLGWVGWILLSTNPFGLVSATGWGHNFFSNGQIQVWNRDAYRSLQPNEQVRGKILDDVTIGRLCAARQIKVRVLNFSDVLAVKMYDTWREAFDGMSKNSHEITGSTLGSILLALFLLVVAWLWVAKPLIGLPLLALSTFAAIATVRGHSRWTLLAPISLTIGAITILRSIVWHKTGRVKWKGRVYPSGR